MTPASNQISPAARIREKETQGHADDLVDYFLAGRPAIARVIASDQHWRQGAHSLEWIHGQTGRKIEHVPDVWRLDDIPPKATIYIYLMAEEAVATPEAIKQLRKALSAHRRNGGRVEYVG